MNRGTSTIWLGLAASLAVIGASAGITLGVLTLAGVTFEGREAEGQVTTSGPASHVPLPTLAIDAESSDNSFALNQRNNNALNVPDVDQCLGVVNPAGGPTQVTVDVILNGAPEVVFYDVRLNLKDQAGNLLPIGTAEVSAMTQTIGVDGTTGIGFINLPVLRNGTLTTLAGNTRRAVSEAVALNDAGGVAREGTSYLAVSYQQTRNFFFSPDSPHPGTARTNTTLSAGAVAGAVTISLTSAAGFAAGDLIMIGNTAPATASEEKKITAINGTNVDLSSGLANGYASGVTVQKGEPYQVIGAGALIGRVTIQVQPAAANSVIKLDLSTSAIAAGVTGPGSDVGLGVAGANGELATEETGVPTEAQLTDAFIVVSADGTVGTCPPAGFQGEAPGGGGSDPNAPNGFLLTANRDRLAICIRAIGVDSAVESEAKSLVDTALGEMSKHPSWLRSGFADLPPLVETNCDPPSGVYEPADAKNPPKSISDVSGHAVDVASYFRVHVYILPQVEIERLTAESKFRLSTEEFVCDGDDCRGATHGLYLTADEAADVNYLADKLLEAIGLNAPSEP